MMQQIHLSWLWKHFDISLRKHNEGFHEEPDIFCEPCIQSEFIEILPKNTELVILDVLSQGRGSSGECLRVIAKDNLRNMEFDLPACNLLHPSPFMVFGRYPFNLDEIIPNEQFLEHIKCANEK